MHSRSHARSSCVCAQTFAGRLRHGAGDALARAHLLALANVVDQALTARTLVPAATPPPK